MQHVIDSTPAIFTMRFLIMKELIFKIATLSTHSREFVRDRLNYIKKERIMTFRIDSHHIPVIPRHFRKATNLWIPTLITQVTLILQNGVEFNYLVWILNKFKPNIVLNLEFENFTDEEVGSEKFMELLGYYTINEVTMAKSSFVLKSSASYLIGPAKKIRAQNSVMKFQRIDQVLSCELFKVENCKIYIAHQVDCLFANVKRCHMNNTFIKENWPVLFSSNLKELVVKRTVNQ
jgi:hypothetical protein